MYDPLTLSQTGQRAYDPLSFSQTGARATTGARSLLAAANQSFAKEEKQDETPKVTEKTEKKSTVEELSPDSPN